MTEETSLGNSAIIVPILDVPNVITAARKRRSKNERLYLEAKALGLDGSKALCISVSGPTELRAIREWMRRRAASDFLVCCSSRDKSFKQLFVWLVRDPDLQTQGIE